MRVVIDAIEPSAVAGASSPWVYADDRRELAPGSVCRWYRFQWSKPAVVIGGATGNSDTEVRVRMELVVDYRAVRAEELDFLVEQDHWDLHDALQDGLDPEIPGLIWLEPGGVDLDDGRQATHVFTVQYMRAR